MTENTVDQTRLDEVLIAYLPSRRADFWGGLIFWIVVLLSFTVLFSSDIPPFFASLLKYSFLAASVVLFGLLLCNKIWWLPYAERRRRKQLLADAFSTPITPDTTVKYYNNGLPPGVQRLAANVAENSFFGSRVSSRMLRRVRAKSALYFLSWLIALAIRHDNMDVVLWLTQFLFSADIITYWVDLEVLRSNHQRTFDDLYEHFLHGHTESDPTKGTAAALFHFADYESAKSRAGIILDNQDFNSLNAKLSEEWKGIRDTLSIP